MKKEGELYPLLRQGVAEFIGTMFLALAVGVFSVGTNLYPQYQALFLPLGVGIVLAVQVYLFGPVSGGHCNPAVSLGVFLFRKLRGRELLAYWVAQILGALAGIELVKTVAGSLTGTLTESLSATGSATVAGEFLGSFLLVFTVVAVVSGRISEEISGLAVGAALGVGASIAAISGAGLLNPALAIGLQAYHVSYLVAPLLGGFVAASIAAWLYQEEA